MGYKECRFIFKICVKILLKLTYFALGTQEFWINPPLVSFITETRVRPLKFGNNQCMYLTYYEK